MTVWLLITSFGTAAALFPLALTIACWLLAVRAWRGAILWLAMIGSASVLVALTKLVFFGWGIGIRALDFTCISGHSMLACAVYPVAGYLIFARAGRALRIAGTGAGIAFGLTIGLSRIIVHAHSPSEVVAGCALGSLVALLYLAQARVPADRRLHPAWIGATVIVLVASLHQEHLPTQQFIVRTALLLSGHKEPYERPKWLLETGMAPVADQPQS